MIRSIKTRTDVKERAKLIIKCYFDNNISRCSDELNVSRNKIKRWKRKWIENKNLLTKTELEEPALFKLPISHWTADALRETAIKFGIVEKISSRQISRYLKQIDINIYKYQQWINSIESNPDFEEYMKKVKKISDIYTNSDKYAEKGTAIISTDEKTGIQALEHKYPARPVIPGFTMKIEQEYKRNGTTVLIASRDINSGKVIPMLIQGQKKILQFMSKKY